MALDLEQLNFQVDTSQLKAAVQDLDKLSGAVTNVSTAIKNTSKSNVQAAKEETAALKEKNKQAVSTAKAQAEIAAANAKAEAASSRLATAQTKEATAALALERKTLSLAEAKKRFTGDVEAETNLLDKARQQLMFMIEGNSKAVSSLLQRAKAQGATNDELKELVKVQDAMRKLQGNEPFDKSIGATKVLRNEIGALREAYRQAANGIDLTTKQAKDLYREKYRLIEQHKIEGSSLSKLKQDLRDANTEYVKLAKTQKGLADANYVDQSKQRADRLSRMLAPQISDVVVSLGSGQSPFTVMLQQGLQVRDLIGMSGVAVKDLQGAMQKAGAEMVSTIGSTFTAIGGMIMGTLEAAGVSLLKFTGKMTGLSAVWKSLLDYTNQNFGAGAAKGLEELGARLATLAGPLVATAIAALVALSAAFLQVEKAQTQVAISNAQFGGTFGANTEEVLRLANAMSSVGVTSSEAISSFEEIVKAGNISKAQFQEITISATNFSRILGGEMKDAIKVYSETIKDPVKGLTEFGLQTGYVSLAQIEMVNDLLKAGKGMEAQTLALKLLNEGYNQMTTEAMAGMSGLDLAFKDIKVSFGAFWDEFKKSAYMDAFVAGIKGVITVVTALGTVLSDISDIATTAYRQLGRLMTFDGSGFMQEGGAFFDRMRQRGQNFKNFLDELWNGKPKADPSDAKLYRDNPRVSNVKEIADNTALAAVKERIAKTDKETLTRQEYINKNVEEYNKKLGTTVMTEEMRLALVRTLGMEYDKANKPKATGGPKVDPLADLAAKVEAQKEYIRQLKDENVEKSAVRAADEEVVKVQKQLNSAKDAATKAIMARKLALTQEYAEGVKVKTELETKAKVEAEYAKVLESARQKEEQHTAALEQKAAEMRAAATEYGKSKLSLEEYRKALIETELQALQFSKAKGADKGYDTSYYDDQIAKLERQLKAQGQIVSETGAAATKKMQESIEQTYDKARDLYTVYEEELKLTGLSAEERERIVELKKIDLKYTEMIKDLEKSDSQDKDNQRRRLEDAKALEKLAKEGELRLKEWQKLTDQISQSLTDALMRGFESGKGFAENFRDTLKNLFKTLVLRPVINFIVNPIAGMISSGISGLLGGAGAQVAASAGSSLGGSLLGSALGSVFSSGSSMLTTGLSNVVGMLGGDSLGVMMAGQSAGLGSAIATAIGQIPVWGWIVGGLALLASKLDDSGTYHSGGLAQYSAAGGLQTSQQHGAFGMGFGGVDFSQAGMDIATNTAKGLTMMLDSVAEKFGKKAGYSVAAAFADDTSKDGAWGGLLVKDADGKTVINWDDTRTSRWAPKEFADGKKGAEEYLSAVAKDVREYLITQTPKWADDMLNALGDSVTLDQLNTTLQQVSALADVLGNLSMATASFGNVTEDVIADLIKNLGGAQSAAALLGSYYENYYSEAERVAIYTEKLRKEFEALGLSLPDSREQLRGLIEAAMAAGDTKLAAQLMELAQQFLNISASATASADKIRQEHDSLMQQWYEVTGNTAELRRLQLLQLDESNRALQQQIWDYQDQQKAAEEAQRAAEEATRAYETAFNEAKTFLDNFAKSIKDFIASLSPSSSTEAGLRYAKSAYEKEYALAQGGNRDSMSSLTSYAGKYVEAIKANARSAEDYNLQVARLKVQLGALPGQIRPEQLIVDAINAGTTAVTSQIVTSGNNTVIAIEKGPTGYSGTFDPFIQALNTNFASLDTTLDGLLDFNEFQLGLAGKASDDEIKRLFNLIDLDNDKIISNGEAALAASNTFGQQVGAALQNDFGNLDTSLDGLLDFDEFKAGLVGLASEDTLKRTFNELDANGDGVISALEAIRNNTGDSLILQAQNDFSTGARMTVQFAPDDPLRAIFNNISRTNELLIDAQQQTLYYLLGVGFNENLQATGPQDSVILGTYSLMAASTFSIGRIESYIKDVADGSRSFKVRGETTAFAKGGAFTNSIVNSPTYFDMGLMGEAGAEAIMPLRRTPTGELGVISMPAVQQSNSNEAVVTELRALRQEVSDLRYETRATAINTAKTEKILNRVTNYGEAMQTVITETANVNVV